MNTVYQYIEQAGGGKKDGRALSGTNGTLIGFGAGAVMLGWKVCSHMERPELNNPTSSVSFSVLKTSRT